MSPPDKPITDLMPPPFAALTLSSLAGLPGRAGLPQVFAAPVPTAGTGQFGPGAMPRLLDDRVIYTVPCQAGFRGSVLALARRRGVDAAELVRMVLALASPTVRASIPDPGAPNGDDRDTPLRRHGSGRQPLPSLTPTLLLRLEAGLDHATIRQALAMALALDDPKGYRLIPTDEYNRLTGSIEKLEYRNSALARAIDRLSFRPRPGRLSLRDAATMLGFASERECDEHLVTRRFRELAPIFHPDTGILPCRERMAQLIEARNLLVKHLRAPK
jgi:hypothetical protein